MRKYRITVQDHENGKSSHEVDAGSEDEALDKLMVRVPWDEVLEVIEITPDRLFCEWENGSWLNSLGSNFVQDLIDMIRQYGPPSKIEVRKHDEGWQK